MNRPSDAPCAKTPLQVWVVSVIALLWNCVGAFDYLMTELRNASYMNAFTREQLAYFYGFPKWAIATWALSVWGGVLGSVALLFRKRWAVPVFALSLAAMTLTFFYNFVLSNGIAIMGGAEALLFPALVLVVGVALPAYARGLTLHGILR